MHDKMQVERDGLRYEVLEDAPNAEKISWNLPGKEEQLENFCKSLKNLGDAGIKVIKVQHMPPVRLMIPRTYFDKPTRGGATSTAFDYNDIKDAPPTSKYGTYTEEQVWENIACFLKGTLPTAECCLRCPTYSSELASSCSSCDSLPFFGNTTRSRISLSRTRLSGV